MPKYGLSPTNLKIRQFHLVIYIKIIFINMRGVEYANTVFVKKKNIYMTLASV